MSRDTSLRVRIETDSKTCLSQARASERKRRNRLEKKKVLQSEAERLGITVEELKRLSARECSLLKVRNTKLLSEFAGNNPGYYYRTYR